MSLARRTEILLLIFAVMSGVLGGFTIWQYSHVGALWFEVLIVVLTIGFLSELAWIFVCTAIFALCMVALAIQQSLPPMPIPAQSQQSVAVATPAPTFHRAMEARPNAGIAFGGLHIGRVGGFPIVVNGFVPFRVHTGENGQLICDVRIYSIGTKQIVEVKDNVIQNLPDGWDANSNQNGMEIVNENQQPVFQMYYESPTVIRIQGIIVTPPVVWLAKGEDTDMIGFRSPRLPDTIRQFSLPRFFKYPGDMFPGVPN